MLCYTMDYLWAQRGEDPPGQQEESQKQVEDCVLAGFVSHGHSGSLGAGRPECFQYFVFVYVSSVSMYRVIG